MGSRREPPRRTTQKRLAVLNLEGQSHLQPEDSTSQQRLGVGLSEESWASEMAKWGRHGGEGGIVNWSYMKPHESDSR